jgi:hypothetical protein
MSDVSTHTMKIWRSHFDGVDSTIARQKKTRTDKILVL